MTTTHSAKESDKASSMRPPKESLPAGQSCPESAEWTGLASTAHAAAIAGSLSQSASAEQYTSSIDAIAEYVVSRKVESAVVFFLEAHLPMASVMHSVSLLLQPVMTPLFGAEKIAVSNALLSDRRLVQQLIEAIEERAQRIEQAASVEVS